MGFRSRRWRKRRRKNKKQKQLPKRTSMEDLPLDISLNILKKLPITSLICFKLVSKACYNLATNAVLTPHYQHYQDNPYCLIIRPTIDHDYPLYLIDNGEVARRVNRPKIPKRYCSGSILSSNGLLCLLFYYNIHKWLNYYNICLYNPLTDEHGFLPDPDISIYCKSDNKKSEDFCDQIFGFGFNISTSEYKVVRIVQTFEDMTDIYRRQAWVFTLGTKGREWSEINKPFRFPVASSDIVVGNAIHWLCTDNEREEEYSDLCVILCFDLMEEKFHQIPNPNCEINNPYCSLSVLGGCLVVATDVLPFVRNFEIQVDVWVLKEYGVKESWTKEFVIMHNFPASLFRKVRPLFRLKSGKIGILYDDKVIYSYDPKEETFEIIHPTGLIQDEYFRATHHTPTLISPLSESLFSLIGT